jgi:outer membrane lipoprotein-sorting protein
MRISRATALLFSLLLGAASAADEATLVRLEKNLSGISTVQTLFTQEKDLAVFQQKLVLKGRIVIQNPDRLAWNVDEPLRYTMVIAGNRVSQWDEDANQVQQMSLSANPVLQAVTDQLTKFFSGRYSALTAMFDVRETADSPLTLEFTPRADAVAQKAIRRVTMVFQPDERYIERIVIEELGGDRTTLVFHDTILNAPVDPGAWEVKPRAR